VSRERSTPPKSSGTSATHEVCRRQRLLRLYLKALDLYFSHPFFDFEDALAISHMERSKITEIVSYDRDFGRISGIQRSEP
jgi:predicted nucleic acid-binding protein